MRVLTTNLDGHPLGEVDLTQVTNGHATVNGQVVLAIRPIGSRVLLIVGSRQYCVSTADYWRVIGTAGRTIADDQAA
jgi:hypothetical protein